MGIEASWLGRQSDTGREGHTSLGQKSLGRRRRLTADSHDKFDQLDFARPGALGSKKQRLPAEVAKGQTITAVLAHETMIKRALRAMLYMYLVLRCRGMDEASFHHQV